MYITISLPFSRKTFTQRQDMGVWKHNQIAQEDNSLQDRVKVNVRGSTKKKRNKSKGASRSRE